MRFLPLLCAVWTICCLGWLAGCGGGSATPKTTASSGAKTAAPAEKAPSAKAPAAAGNKHVRVDADGRKWLGDIPYDVFYDDPLAVASNSQAVAATSSATGNAATPAASSEPPAAASDNARGDKSVADWKAFIPMEQLQEETKRIRNHLTASLQSQGTYNGNYKELQVDGAELAALAEIVAKHSEDISWKANAKYIRDLGAELNQTATALGKEPYTKSQSAAEKVIAVLDGSVPADAGKPAATRPFGEVANRAGVMKRIEKASEWMRSNINTEAKFKADIEQIQKESRIIATLGKVIADESYESAAEDDYQKFAKRLIDGGKEAAAAAQDQSYPKFGEAMNKINKVCAECHASYGNG